MRNIGIDEQGAKDLADGLNIYLANLHVLYTKLHNFHWNVEGKAFFQIHSKLEELYNGTAEEIDEVAERILQLGHRPIATMKEYLEVAQLKEAPSKKYTSEEICNSLLDDYSFMANELRKGIKQAEKYDDQVTVGLAVEKLTKLEKTIWMLSAFLA
ncbi:Dps family protein [Serpentinicella alkaliphila]|uniref:Starvation-inducible DNA-binding protein n=1 Tax=Serpentinicella alkaliphila TaxID=1734049 RepID=A0A4R2SYC2_9FIRM|nr:DNA starvation/stationary phase protection protein [Serpentinicella alkaliphila]QUH25757.1 DNA starvation/stationary phase protection protein [Serpentinicella alkaliphila]TCP93494.1 starvation-inducible DNA-binding protein [Serpentinicella alkaliphila]